MRLTKEIKKEVTDIYESYWDSYLEGDIETIVALLDDSYTQVGSAETEVFTNKKDAVQFLYDTVDQVAGKLEMRNRNTRIEEQDNILLVHELCDVYALVENDWIFYSKFRATTILQEKSDGWKIIHQHSSFPDARTDEGENIAIDKVAEENQQLREAIKRRTVDLEIKNKKLKIEASLERIRTIALSMQKAEGLLDVVEIINTELKTLGFTDIRNTIINIFNDIKEKFLNYDYSDYGVGGISEVDYNSHPSNKKLVEKMREASKDFMITEFTGDELDEWRKWRIEQGQMPDSKLDQADSLYYYEYSIGVGSIGISTFSPINADQLEILKKIRNVFDLAYRRYSDIALAEANAREAKIEAGLERVRASAMAMHKSEQLSETAKVLFEEFAILGKIPDCMSIGVIDEVSENVEMWVTDQGGNDINHEFFFSIEEPTSIAKIYAAWKEEKDFALIDLTGQNLKAWLDFVKDVVKLSVDETKIKGRRVQQAAFFSHGFLLLTTHQPISDEIMNLLVRFARVFNQTYTRFLDLLNAEAQAREAQIESALESVRSKTMAMHNSNDVGDTVVTLFDEVLKLGLDNSIRCGIGILEGNEGMETWSATSYPNGEIDLKMGMLDMTVHPLLIGVKNSWKNDKTGFTYELKGNDVTSYYNALNNEPEYPFHVELETLPEKVFHNSFTFSEGILFSFTSNPISEEAAKVLDRFASVFGQTYRRYLDLQKAEAQAREAQIETALERVRSKAMSMYNSEDLAQTVDTFFSELNNLNIRPHRCGVGIVDGETQIADIHATTISQENEIKKVVGKLKLSGHPILDNVFKGWKLQQEYHPVLHGNEILDYYKIMNRQVIFPDFADDEIQYGYYFYFKEGGVFAWTSNELDERDLQIFRRYTSVLSLTYRRYMDLKEAELQAKETKIEIALERVRSRTMAMQTSDELIHVVHTVYKELQHLEFDVNMCLILIYDETTGGMEWWSSGFGKEILPQSYKIPPLNKFIENPMARRIIEAPSKINKYEVYELKGKEKRDWDKILFEHTELKNLPGDFKESMMATESVVLSEAFMSCGILEISGFEPLSESDESVIKRFAKVIDQIYTRFRDIKNVEAKNIIIQAENERKTQELEEARELQLSMLPKELPNLQNLDIAVYMQTATEVGGDYYDFNVGSDGTLTAVIGDATGHGMKAGTMVTITKSLFDSLASEENILNSFSKISSIIKGMKFRHLSMCLTMLKMKGNSMVFSSAAMPPIMIFRSGIKKVEEINMMGMPLGTFKDFPYKLMELELNSNDVILLMSDGFPELLNTENEMYGYERTKIEFHSVGEKNSEEIVNHLKNEVSQWMNGKDLDDDVTFVVIKVK